MTLVTAAIIRDGDRVLLTRRAPGQRHEGFWEFPGGKVDDGETLQECLERELLEELGVASVVGPIICSSEFTYEHGKIRLVALETTVASKEFRPSVHDLVLWVNLDQLLSYQLLPADIPLARSLQNNR